MNEPIDREAFDQVREFWTKHGETLPRLVAQFTGIPRNRCCFQIAKVAEELARRNGIPAEPQVCLLVINDNVERPLVTGHCLVRVHGRFLLDFAYEGPEVYGLPAGTKHEHIVGLHEISRQFGLGNLEPRVAHSLKHGGRRACQWWRELGPIHRNKILEAVDFAAKGGNVVFTT